MALLQYNNIYSPIIILCKEFKQAKYGEMQHIKLGGQTFLPHCYCQPATNAAADASASQPQMTLLMPANQKCRCCLCLPVTNDAADASQP